MVSTTTAIPYVAGEEVLFISDIDNPFLPPNSASVNVGNRISVTGAVVQCER